jgi:hypothetical protein
VPESFGEINTLRTEQQHDLDYGNTGKVSAKRRKISAIFRKHSGNATPETTSPEHFPVFQLSLLSSIASDLRVLSSKQ